MNNLSPYFVIGAVILAVSVAGASKVSYGNGLRDAPAYVDYLRERDAVWDSDWAQIASQPSRREMVCEGIFEAVIDEMNRELFDEQDDRDRIADRR